jgi:hypothetical protein
MFDMTSTPEYGNKQEAIIAPERMLNKVEIAGEGLSGLFGLSGSTK